MKPKAHKAGSTLLHVKTTARCYSLAVDSVSTKPMAKGTVTA